MITQTVFNDIQEALLAIFGPVVSWMLVLLVVVSIFIGLIIFFLYTVNILGRRWF